ncbi:SCO6880 family protein [Nocardioides dokdonensis]|uniref:SCO6880 family protein n=1 Tax=Nocardioides dokdonensis TaxID=450734 RepID=UPI000A809E62|nr:SCO6880 family protein [Nocardioides dokdonensis]
MTIYADYQRDRIGWFFGLSGGQLMFLALASLPAFWAISRGAWFSAFLFALVWLFLLAITVVPVRGRSATGWVFASTMYAVGGLLGWTSFRARPPRAAPRTSTPPISPGAAGHQDPRRPAARLPAAAGRSDPR